MIIGLFPMCGDVLHTGHITALKEAKDNCDVLIVASEISKGVQMGIDFAKLVKMEVMRLDENGELQPFTE